MKQQLIFPMAFYVFYIGSVLLYMFYTRLNAVKSAQVTLGYFRTYSGSGLSDKAIVAGRHYDNQFQVPPLFLLAGVAHLAHGLPDMYTVALAWGFVISRVFHSYIHLGSNNVKLRAVAFTFGWIFVLLMWAQLVCFSQSVS